MTERNAERKIHIRMGEERLLIEAGRGMGEGFDDARLDTLFLALPVSWQGTLIQYTGPLHRLHPGKTEVRIFDSVDRAVAMPMKMFEKRLRGYRAIGYVRDEAPLGREAEDDADVLRDLMTDDEPIVAVCARGRSRRRVPVLDLPLPMPPPEGADWIMAVRRWARGGR